MNKLNDKGQRHGYWETDYCKFNYHNGSFHGEYLGYYDNEKKNLLAMAQFDMDTQIGYWEYYRRDNTINKKYFFL